MAECRAGEFPDQTIIEDDQTYQSDYGDFVNLLSGTRYPAHEVKTGVLKIHEYGGPIRDLKGGGGGGDDGTCTLHAQTGSCPFPALPSPLNFASGSTCRCRWRCPCPPVECPSVKCPPRPVESCQPGIHKQYRDFYPDCKGTHLPRGYRNSVENDDLYLPSPPPVNSNSCYNMPMSSRSCSPPPIQPLTQRCRCCQCPRTLEPNPSFKPLVCPPKPLLCPPKVDRCCSPPSPRCFSFSDEVKSCCFPTPPRCPPLSDQVDPCRSPPPPKCPPVPDQVSPWCFPTSPKSPLPNRADPCHPPPSPIICAAVPDTVSSWCIPLSPQRPLSINQVSPWSPPSPQRVADNCCFPVSPRRLTLPTRVKSSPTLPSSKRLALAKVDSLSPKMDPLSFPKRAIPLALAAQVNPRRSPSPNYRLALPARVSGWMGAEYDTIYEPTNASEKDCVDSDIRRPNSTALCSQKPVQRIYVCLPYAANPSPTSPNCLSSLPKPLLSDDGKNLPNPTIHSELINKIPIISPPPPVVQSWCPECISQTPTPRSPKSPRSRSISPTKPNAKSCTVPMISGVKHLMSSSCQYSPRIDTEGPKVVLLTQKSGPSPPTSPYHLDPSRDPSPCPPQLRRPSPYRPPRPTMTSPQKLRPGVPEPPRPQTQSPLDAELVPVEKHIRCKCGPRGLAILHDTEDLDQSCGRRAVSPSLYEAISRVLRPGSPCPILPGLPHLGRVSAQRMECTCRKLPDKRNSQICKAAQIGLHSHESPSQHSSNSTAHCQRMDNAKMTEFLNDVKRVLKKDFPSRMRPPDHQKQDLKRDFYSSVRSELPLKDFSSSIRSPDRNQESPTSGRRTDQKDELSSAEFLSIVRSTLKPEFPSSSSGRTTERKEDKKHEVSPRTPCKQEASSILRPRERKQEFASCVRTTERGTSPIIGKPVMIDSGTNGSGMESADRPKTDPTNTTTMNRKFPKNPRPLQSAHDNGDAMRRPSKGTIQEDSPPQGSDKARRYGPVEANIPETTNSKHPSQRNFNKRVTPSWVPRAAPNREVLRRGCCGLCKSACSRSHLTTKCPYYGNVHSCCCSMCSCPFPYCTIESPVPDSENSMSATSAGNGKFGHPGSSRPKSLSPFARRSHVAGPREMSDKHGPRSKPSRPKGKARQRERHPRARALLESFNSYLNSQCRCSKTGLTPHRRCSYSHQRSPHWHSPPLSPERNCSQLAKRSMLRQTQRGLQQAPWDTHPILMSSRLSNSRFCLDRIPQPRPLPSGPHRGCFCPRCANGKL